MSDVRSQIKCLGNFAIHKRLLECYESNLSKYDSALLEKNHKFLWQDTHSVLSWEEELAKKYYDKLFKEFCICDLSKYKENKLALRWRTKTEVVSGKGQFICAEKKCGVKEYLKTWEVNFSYIEDKEKKNALVKIKLCFDCSGKLNYHSKKKEVKRLTHISKKHNKHNYQGEKTNGNRSGAILSKIKLTPNDGAESLNQMNIPWTQKNNVEENKTREEEMEDYLQDLLL